MRNVQDPKRGFSLIELSIVLVIIGLIVGGIMTGQSMIRTSELRDILKDEDTFVTAITNFQNKYKSLPGDMKNATTFWGVAAACAGAATPGTCDGDGNGQIGMSSASIPEFLRAWQQLQLAGMIDGNYSGVAGSGGTWHHIITPTAANPRNAPSSKYQGGGYSLYYQPLVAAGDATLYQGSNVGNYGHIIFFGGQANGGNNSNPTVATTSRPILSAEDAYFLDSKIDDGIPNTGAVLATKAGGTSVIPNCTTAGNVYNVATAGRNCAIIFQLGF